MKKLGYLFLFLSAASIAAPYKIVIISDEETLDRAREYKSYMMNKPPYSKMRERDLDIKIIPMTKEEMRCSNTLPGTPRVIVCDETKLARLQAKEEAHLAVAFTSNGSGGSGGTIPVASKDYPLSTMMHEVLHAYGCDDEYEYSESESEIYCKFANGFIGPNFLKTSPNAAFFQDIPPYISDPYARTKHNKHVPWMGRILSGTSITQGSALGTGDIEVIVGQQPIGLFRGGSCQKKITTWRPYKTSIMNQYIDDTIYPIYEDIILQSIEAKIGRKLILKEAKLPTPAKHPEDEECPPALEGSLKDINDLMKVLAN